MDAALNNKMEHKLALKAGLSTGVVASGFQHPLGQGKTVKKGGIKKKNK